ncbi:hypothetical protein [Mycobacteroides saopaulense]|uniref:DUF4333 domain-containing protein n=1 Tax=Mycobacteroides saopaulense TaxID=1578165 RepID=A0ABX3C3M7_9MYCO|nr:hypothetical protein [Mycobacteroides saopaulense]OHT81309.1 hypothetical protein BKG68_22475 [Mycobacteroides saopaulense]OHU12981.1 hypothetical protein BKG73_05750 [Mycobacteroides saopaulense]
MYGRLICHRLGGLCVAAATVGALIAAPPAGAGPKNLGNADLVVASLKARGDRVVVNRRGNTPLNECVATSVREGRSQYRWQRVRGADPTSPLVQVLDYRVMHVSVEC